MVKPGTASLVTAKQYGQLQRTRQVNSIQELSFEAQLLYACSEATSALSREMQ